MKKLDGKSLDIKELFSEAMVYFLQEKAEMFPTAQQEIKNKIKKG